MGRNADAILVAWCPDDKELGEPLLLAGANFGVVDFTLSLRDRGWPLGMVVEYEGKEWMVVPGTDENGHATQVIISESDVVKGPASNGQYFIEYTWAMDRHQAKPRHIDPGKKAVLTETEVVEIYSRYMYDLKRPTQTELAHEYGVGQKQISNIVLKKAWAYLWK